MSFNEIKYRSMIQLDYYGASLLCISLTSLILLITKFEHEASSIFLSKPALLITFCLSAILFVLIEKKAPNPVLPLTLLQINNFRFYSLIGFLTGSILFSILTFIPFYLQVCRGVTPTNSGLQIIPLTIGIIFGTTISGIIMTKLGNYKLLPFSGSIILFRTNFFK